MKNRKSVLWMLLSVGVLTGCQSFTGFDFDSDAIVGGGAVAGKDYITGLKPSLKAREYFVKSNANASQKKTVTPGNDQGTGVVWTDDGGIVIPPGCSIEFENKGYCLDPHLPAPGAGHEMQFVRIASLLPDELQGTYRNLLKRSAAGDEDVKNNMQRLVWALRTAGSQDVMATHLTERQREILSECADNGSFEDYVYRQEMYGKIVEELKSKFVNKIKDSTSVRVGNVVYDAFDLLDPDKGKQKVEAHLQSLISMGLNLPVKQTGFNYGELENGIFTDIKGTGTLSFKAKIANSTSQPYTFYPMNYAAQVGSGGSSVGFYAAANSGMRQRVTIEEKDDVEVEKADGYHVVVKPFDLIGQSIELSYEAREIPLPGGGLLYFEGGRIKVDIRDMDGWLARFENGFKDFPKNAGAFTSREDKGFSLLWDNVYVKPSTTMAELEHEGIHVLTKVNDELRKYKGTKNEEYLAYIISGTGGKTPKDVMNHIDSDPVYDTKQWISW